MKKQLLIVGSMALVLSVVLSGCSSKEAVTPEQLTELTQQIQNLDNKIVLMKQEMENQQKQIDSFQDYIKQDVYTKLEKEQAKYIEVAETLMLKLINAKTAKTQAEYEGIIKDILVDPTGFLKTTANVKVNEYEPFEGTYTEPKISISNDGIFIFEAKLKGSGYNKKTKKKEEGNFQIHLEFIEPSTGTYKITNSKMTDL